MKHHVSGFIRRIWLVLIRVCLLIPGIVLLSIAIPHNDPWNMSLVSVKGDRGEEVVINFPIVRELAFFPIRTSARNIFITAGIALVVLMLLTPSGKRAAINCIKKIKPVPAVLFSIGALIFTLKPTINGMPVVLYLTFGSIGLLFSLVAIYPLFIWLGKYRVGDAVRRAVRRVSLFIYNVNIIYFLGTIFALVFAATNLSSYFIFEHIPHIQDSIDQVFHGQIFAPVSYTHLTLPTKRIV